MFQSYYLKWCFTLIGILAIGTLLMRLGNYSTDKIGQYIIYVLSVTFYILSCWFIHGYFKQHTIPGVSNYVKFIISVILGMLAILVASYLINLYTPSRLLLSDMRYQPNYADCVRLLIGSFFLSMMSYIVYNNIDIINKLQQTKLENEQFKQAHLRAQLLSLQQQISPHFLFNSLSTLKTIARDRDTKNFVVELSHVYRYLLNFNEHEVTKLSDELTFINSYLYILHQRFDSTLNVSIDVPEQYQKYLIPPLSIQLLIENAIKHNAISPEMPLHIAISVNDREELVVQNPYQPKKIPVESTRLGLQNINDRFRLLFNKEISISHTERSFTVRLPLISYERYYH